VPGIVIAAPVDEYEMDKMLELALSHPSVSRSVTRAQYPRMFDEFPKRPFATGEGEVLFEGEDVTLLALGSMVEAACKAHALLKQEGISARVVNMRFTKPLDEKLILGSLAKPECFLRWKNMSWPALRFQGPGIFRNTASCECSVRRLGLPDAFIEHGSARPAR